MNAIHVNFAFMRFFFFFFLLLGITQLSAQDDVKPEKRKRFYLYWGWNTAHYTKSDISFKGKDFDFTLKKVVGKDRQSKFNVNDYLNPVRITIPQTNARIGYYLNDKYDISLGFDHMKYVLQNYQDVAIEGTIEVEGDYEGVYNGETINLEPEFILYENTDGLNYVNVELRRRDTLLSIPLGFTDVSLHSIVGAGLGFMMPRTDATILGYDEWDEFHISGVGTGLVTGLNIGFLKHFFFQTELKGGYIDMRDLRITEFKDDKAKQNFWYLQHNIVFGGTIGF